MPTSKKRVMLSLPGDLEEKLEKVAKVERRPLAGLCVALIEAALNAPRYREILETAPLRDEGIVEEFGLDKLTPERLQELGQLLQLLEKMKRTAQ